MIVTCESCNTKFRFDPTRLKGPRGKVRCSRCGFVFPLEKPEDEVHIHVDLDEDALPDDDDLEFPSPEPPSSIKPEKQGLLRRLLILGGVLVVIGGIVFWYTSDRESTTPGSTQHDKASNREVEQPTVTILGTSLQAYFLENSHAGGQIFVVEGEVANESNKPVSFILLEGKLYSAKNQVAQSQRCFSGNTMTREELTRLSVTEIQNRMMNREGKNLSNVHVPPAKRIPFMLVFQNLPELGTLSDYSVEVISSKAD